MFRWKDDRAPGPVRREASGSRPSPSRRTSSSTASCCMSCPTASTASATTACSPTAHGPPTSPGSGACSQRRPAVRPSPNPPTTSHRRLPAPAAADASQSSSASAGASLRRHVRASLSGSTPHDRRPARDRDNRPMPHAATDPPRARSRHQARSDLFNATRHVQRSASSCCGPGPGRPSARLPRFQAAPQAPADQSGAAQNPHRSRQRRHSLTVPRFPPLEGFRRRPRTPATPSRPAGV
jgi:hypothetical protein